MEGRARTELLRVELGEVQRLYGVGPGGLFNGLEPDPDVNLDVETVDVARPFVGQGGDRVQHGRGRVRVSRGEEGPGQVDLEDDLVREIGGGLAGRGQGLVPASLPQEGTRSACGGPASLLSSSSIALARSPAARAASVLSKNAPRARKKGA